MSFAEALADALRHLAAHRLRAVLTMLGIVFGVGAVIAMLAIGAGAEREALRQIARLGRQNLVLRSVEPKPEEVPEVRKRSVGLAWRDVDAIANGVPGVAQVVPKIQLRPYQLYSRSGKTKAEVMGVSAAYPSLVGLELGEGRSIDAADAGQYGQVALIGPAVRRELFGYGPALGEFFKVDDLWLEVIGVLAEAGKDDDTFQGVALGAASRLILLPVTTAERKFDRDPQTSPFAEIVVRIDDAHDPRLAAQALGGLMKRLHAGAEDYELVVPEALLDQSRKTQRLFNLVMGSIAGISLLVGGIGIMNIMLASVLERTHEIGVRRAVGARQRDVRLQFLVESFAISLLGGAIGILMGVAIATLVAAWAGWTTVVTPGSVLLASGVATAVGVISGWYPAARAAALDPIEALRYE